MTRNQLKPMDQKKVDSYLMKLRSILDDKEINYKIVDSGRSPFNGEYVKFELQEGILDLSLYRTFNITKISVINGKVTVICVAEVI